VSIIKTESMKYSEYDTNIPYSGVMICYNARLLSFRNMRYADFRRRSTMEDNHEADDLLYRIETAADSLQYIAYGLMQQIGDDCEEGNAVQYVAYSIRENVKRARKLLFQKEL